MTNSRRTHAQRNALSDRAMFRAAIQIIAREGFDGFTLVKVGNLSGYSPALVTYHYGSKIGLLKAVAERKSELWQKILTQGDDSPNNEVAFLKKNSANFLDSVRDRNDFVLTLLRMVNEGHSVHPELLSYTKVLEENIHRFVAAIVHRGINRKNILPAVDPDLFAVIYLGTLRGVAMQYIHHPAAVDMEAVKREVDQVCMLRLQAVGA